MQQEKQDKVVAISPGKGRLGAVQRGQLISRLREHLRDALMQRIRIMLENVDDAFFARADKAENNQQQALYFEAMREVRLKRQGFEGDFVAGILKNFERGLTPGVGRHAETQRSNRAGSELSLVETDELEERLAIDGMVGKARRLYPEELYMIGQRLAALSSQTAPSADEDISIGPRTICDAFSEAAGVLEMSIQPKLVLYKLFDRFVIGELGEVYAGFNLILREAGLLPNLRAEPPEREGAPRRSRPSHRTAGARSQSAQPRTSLGEEGYEDEGNDDLAVALQAFLDSVRTQGPAVGGYPVGGGAPVVAGNELVGALTQLQRSISGGGSVASIPFAGGMLKDELRQVVTQEGAGVQSFTPGDENTIDIVAMLFDFIFEDPSLPEPFKGAIARLQIPMLKVALIDRSFLTRKHHPARRLLNLMARAGIGWTPNTASDENDLLVRVERLVGRVVNEFEDDIEIFGKVLEEFESQLDSDEHAAYEREAQEAEQSLRRETREISKAVASAAIDQVLVGSSVPREVGTFLRGPWRDLLAGIHANTGSESQPWMKALNVASTLVWSLMPKDTEAGRTQLLETLPSVLRALRDGMEKLNVPYEKRDELFACLALEHSRLAKMPSRSTAQPVTDVDASPAQRTTRLETERSEIEPIFDAPLAKDAPAPEDGLEAMDLDLSSNMTAASEADESLDQKSFMARKTDEINRMIAEGRFRGAEAVTPKLEDSGDVILDEFLDCAESLEEGTWLDWTDREGSEQRVKLSWRSIISGKFFFVNRQGVKVVEMTAHALATELRESRARIIEDAPVVDRALMSALDSLNESQG